MAKLGKVPTKRRGRSPKVTSVAELEKIFSNGDGVVLLNNLGLTVAQISDLRRKLRQNKSSLKVAKNTLIRLALENTGYDVSGVDPYLEGPTMFAIGLEDPVSPAKTIVEFLKDVEGKAEIKGGILEKKALSATEVTALSKLPSREELLAKMLGSLQAPIQKTVFALNACVSQVVWATDAYRRKLEEGNDAA